MRPLDHDRGHSDRVTPVPQSTTIEEFLHVSSRTSPRPKSRQVSRNRPRPGRTLVILFVVMAGMLATMLLTGATNVKLGLDLAGGTSVTLLPRNEQGGGQVTSAQLAESVKIIRKRVNGLGVNEPTVGTQGGNIVVQVPGATGEEALKLISSTAQLRFRTVVTAAPSGPGATLDPGLTDPGATNPTDPAATEPADPAATEPPASDAPSTEPTEPTVAPVPEGGVVSPNAAYGPVPLDQTPDPAATPDPAISQPAPAPTETVPPLLSEPIGNPIDVFEADGQVTPRLQKAFQELDCSDPANRQGGLGRPAAAAIVACNQEGTEKYILSPTQIEGTQISNSQAGQRQTTGEPVVNLEFNKEATQIFGKLSGELFQNQGRFAIVLDDVVVSAPGITSGAILGGRAEITGNFTQKSAEDLSSILRFGALPVTFEQGDVQSVSATVGQDQLSKGLLAGIIGLLLVAVYSLLFYRALGIVSVASLLVAGALTYMSVALLGSAIGFSLVLAGVIGLIVSIGITADSFVVYFERVRDEVRQGRAAHVAAERGWHRARRTILVADAVALLAAVVLYFLSIGSVANFAFTLGLTTVVDVAVVFFFTKPLVTILVRRGFFRDGHRLSGLNPESIGAALPRPRAGRPRQDPPTPSGAQS